MTQARVLCAVVAVTSLFGCGRSGVLAGAGDDGTPAPEGTAAPTPTPFEADTGDGHDGPWSLAGANELDLCVPIAAASGKTVTLADAARFVAGDRVFLHQVTDAFAPQAGSPLANIGRAGMWTIARVTAVAGAALTLDIDVPLFESGPSSAAQACLAPELDSLVIAGRVTTRAWDGASGGVIVLFVNGPASIEEIDVDGAGFRGGNTGPFSQARLDLDDVMLGDGGGKGEGVRAGTRALAGRGSTGTEGGGGNGRAAGGGGGAGGGAGGSGGWETDAVSNYSTAAAGHGGAAIDPNALLRERLTFGGGGGAGQRDDGNGGEGGSGGGIVVIFAESFTGSLGIWADGGDGDDAAGVYENDDGAGGGGGGGSILLWSASPSSPSPVTVSANGGLGGDTWETPDGGGVIVIGPNPSGGARQGPGGGGGGGRVHVERISVPAVSTEGGEEGWCFEEGGYTVWGATEGAPGTAVVVP